MKLKRFTKIITFMVFLISAHASATTILIDPGHGGEELGATGFYKDSRGKKHKVYEKDLALEIAKRIYEELKPKYSTYLTRSVDRTVTLDERAELAEKVKADLIISVHLNSYKNKKTGGFETYYLDNHADSAVKKVEQIENKGLKGEDLVINQILIDLVVQKTVKSSRTIAGLIHKMLKKKVQKPFRIKDRKVRPGLFYVLALSKRPGVLAEAGFMTNPKELKKMVKPKFQKSYAEAVTKAIDIYFKKYSRPKVSLF